MQRGVCPPLSLSSLSPLFSLPLRGKPRRRNHFLFTHVAAHHSKLPTNALLLICRTVRQKGPRETRSARRSLASSRASLEIEALPADDDDDDESEVCESELDAKRKQAARVRSRASLAGPARRYYVSFLYYSRASSFSSTQTLSTPSQTSTLFRLKGCVSLAGETVLSYFPYPIDLNPDSRREPLWTSLQ